MAIYLKALCMGTNAIETVKDAHLFVNVSPEDNRTDTNEILSTLSNHTAVETRYQGYHWTIPNELHLEFSFLEKQKKTCAQFESFTKTVKWISAAVSAASFTFSVLPPHQPHLRRLAFATVSVFSGLLAILSHRRISEFAQEKRHTDYSILNQREKIERFRGKAYENLFSIFDDIHHPLIEEWTNSENPTTTQKILEVKGPQSFEYPQLKDRWPNLLTDPELKAAFSHWKSQNNLTDTFDPEQLLIRTFLRFKSSLKESDSGFVAMEGKFKSLFEDLSQNPDKGPYLTGIIAAFNNFKHTLPTNANNVTYFEYALKLLWTKIVETKDPLDIAKRTEELYENLFLVFIFHEACKREDNPSSRLQYFNQSNLDPSIKSKLEKLHNKEFFKSANQNRRFSHCTISF